MENNSISLSEKAFSNLENQKISGITSDDSLKKIIEVKEKSLKEVIDEIKFLIEQREEMSKVILSECDSIKLEIKNFLMLNKAVDAEDFKERNGLRLKQIEISEIQLNEKVNCWRDVAQLKQELRERQKELSEKQGRGGILSGILD